MDAGAGVAETVVRMQVLGGKAATFFASDGQTIIPPEPKQYFEAPIQGSLPEDLKFIP